VEVSRVPGASIGLETNIKCTGAGNIGQDSTPYACLNTSFLLLTR